MNKKFSNFYLYLKSYLQKFLFFFPLIITISTFFKEFKFLLSGPEGKQIHYQLIDF